MTKRQTQKLIRITDRLNYLARHDGGLTFSVETCEDGVMLLFANNLRTRSDWYQTTILVTMRIGPLGGSRVYEATGIDKNYIA